jgi:hypothetical protein
MADNETRAVIVLEADKSSAAATQRLLANIADGVKDLGKGDQLKRLDRSFEDLKKDFQQSSASADTFTNRLQKVRKDATELTETYDELIEREKFLTKFGESGPSRKGDDGPRTRLEQFEEVEQTSGKVGDLGDALAALGSATGIGALGDLGAIFEGIEALARAKAGFEALPEALDATAKAVGLTRTAQAAATTTSVAATAAETAQAAANTTVATTAVSAAAGVVALAVAAAPIAIIGAAVAAAFILVKGALDAQAASAQANADKIKRAYEATDTVFDSILSGDTSEDARQKIEAEQQKLTEANNQASIAFQQSQQRFAEIASKWGVAAAEIAKNRGTDEFPVFAERMKEQQTLAAESAAKIEEYNKALTDNKFAANDAKEAEEKRKEEQEKADREAQQKEEQKRRDIESTQERILDSNLKFSQKQEDDARAAAQKLDDIERSARDKRVDLAQKYRDDLTKIGLDAQRDDLDAVRKQRQAEADAEQANRQAEVDAVLKQQRTLEDIRKDALRSEADQLKQRNFLGAALAGEAAQQLVDDANKDAEREAQDRAVQAQREAEERALNNQREAQDRQLAFNRARQDRMTAFQIEQRDAATAEQRALRDAQIAQLRQEENTRIGYEREQAQLQEHMNKILEITAEGQAAERAIKSGQNPALRSSNTTNNSNSNTTINDNRSLAMNLNGGGAAIIEDMMRRVALNTMRQVRYS